ncbi:hypothetical protein QJS04_geneDACA023825 [Acorus gramineus]|uniref:Uncharacterized protein n=1 Tax=Acorus gramineus TaxID=55184 RepID=A0AAV9AM33_ACOGR|nr:hypothetical protein QJS04_geneDACA023825 [Acorus gramineus]
MNDMDISIPSTKQPTNPGLSHVRKWDSARTRTWSPPPSPSRLSGVFPSFHPPRSEEQKAERRITWRSRNSFGVSVTPSRERRAFEETKTVKSWLAGAIVMHVEDNGKWVAEVDSFAFSLEYA